MNQYILSKESVTVILDGLPRAIPSDHPSYDKLLTAVKAGDWEAARSILQAKETVIRVLGQFGEVEVLQDKVTWRGEELNGYLVGKILETPEDIEPLARFLDNVQRNPDPRARADLFRWVEAGAMPITTDGQVLAYKYVRSDFMDCFTGTFDHHPGKIPAMRREDCDPDPNQTCSRGLHFCSRSYLDSYGGGHQLVKLKVNPADVVAFPTDYGLSKGRACRYEVIEAIDWATEFDSSGYTEAVRPLAPGDKVRVKAGIIGEFSTRIGMSGTISRIDPEASPQHCSQTWPVGVAFLTNTELNGKYGYPLSILERIEEEPAPEQRFYIVDTDDDYVNFDADGSGYDDLCIEQVDARTYTRAEAEALINSGIYDGDRGPLRTKAAPEPEPVVEPEPEPAEPTPILERFVVRCQGIGGAKFWENERATQYTDNILEAHVFTEGPGVGVSFCDKCERLPAPDIVDDAPRFYVVDEDGDYWFVRADGSMSHRTEPTEVTDAQATTLMTSSYAGGYSFERRPVVPEAPEVTILNRIVAIETHLNLVATGTITERLDAIDRELGLDKIEPLIARLDRAESQLGLS